MSDGLFPEEQENSPPFVQFLPVNTKSLFV